MNFKEVGLPTIKLFVIATVITVLLFLTNNITVDKIAENQAASDAAARQEVLPAADAFEEKTVTVDGEEYTYYEATNGAGYVFSGTSKGYGGEVVCMIGIDPDGQITGVAVTEQSETAGLGAKWAGSADADKREQFTAWNAADGPFAVTKDGGDVTPVSGATITSRAVTSDVNSAIAQYQAVVGGAN